MNNVEYKFNDTYVFLLNLNAMSSSLIIKSEYSSTIRGLNHGDFFKVYRYY